MRCCSLDPSHRYGLPTHPLKDTYQALFRQDPALFTRARPFAYADVQFAASNVASLLILKELLEEDLGRTARRGAYDHVVQDRGKLVPV